MPPTPNLLPPDKVLVVDDDALIREMVSDLVRHSGAEPVAVSSSAEAIGALATLEPLAVLMDLYMPDGAGDECCRIIKGNAELSSVPVVLMTSAESEDEARRAFNAGAEDFLAKPVRAEQLSAKLAAIRAGVRKAPPEATAARVKTVLVADDDNFFRTLVGHSLERAEYQVLHAKTGLEALQVLYRGRPRVDLAIVDLVMPGIGGLELIRKLREPTTFPRLPVLVVSGSAQTPRLAEELGRLGVMEVVAKQDLNGDEVLARVNSQLFQGAETRAIHRVRFYRVCEFRHPGEDWASGFIYNLSSGGVAVRTLTPAPEGKVIDIRFALAKGIGKLVAKATVAWANEFHPKDARTFPYGMGLGFAEISEEAQRQIDALMKAG